MTTLQFAAGLSFPEFTAGLTPVSVVFCKGSLKASENGDYEALNCRVAKVCCGGSQASSGEEGTTSERLQDFPWREFFADPTRWWDNRRTKKNPRHPDFRHKNSKPALWFNSWYKPPWVELQLAMCDAPADAGMRKASLHVSTSVPGASARLPEHEGYLEVRACRKLCEDGPLKEAVDALNLLVQQGCHIPNSLYYRVLKRCTAQKDLVLARRIHALAVDSGYEGNAFLANHLISLYASHGNLEEAMGAFSKVTAPSTYMWASIIFAYARHGKSTQAIKLYRQMTVKPDNRIFVAILKACAKAGDLAVGKDVHAHICASAAQSDIYVQTCLVDMYAKCGSLDDAQRVFDSLPQKDVVTWTAMIAGYSQHGMGQEALNLYSTMQQEGITHPSSVTFVCLLQACASIGVAALQQGKQLHVQIQERKLQADVVVGASLVNMYVKCESLKDAQRVFEALSQKNLVTWTTMIAGYAQQGMGKEALSLYSCMQQECITPPDAVTFVCLLHACARIGVAALQHGKQLHLQIDDRGLQADALVGASLVNMYAKCRSLENAQRVFDGLSQKKVGTWNAMIAGYAQQGMGQKALTLYNSMQKQGITPPDTATFVCLLQACASAAALPLGKQLHSQIKERGLQADPVLGPSLVNMYAKCGSLVAAQHVFDVLFERDILAWGALISGYAHQGDSEVVFDLFDRMRQEGIRPNHITFLSVLTVCSHVGLVDKGRKYFKEMIIDHGITPTIEHYRCMMDLLGRAGHLHEALQMVKTMPFQPDSAVWLTLLGSCQKWTNVEIGQQAFEFAVRLDEKDAAAYVLMSNIYLSAQMWEEAMAMQARRKKYGAWKQPGQSWWTDMDGVVHSFVVRNRKHSESPRMRMVATAGPKMKKEGIVTHVTRTP